MLHSGQPWAWMGEESVDDILAELNAINLEGEDDTSQGDPYKVVEHDV